MKVKAIKVNNELLGLTEGKEYEVLASMPSSYGGDWAEVVCDLGVPFIIRIGGPCAFGEWEYVE